MESRKPENPKEQDLIRRYTCGETRNNTSTNDIKLHAIPITCYDDDKNGIDRANCVAVHVDDTTNINATTAIELRKQVDHYHPYFPLEYYHPHPSFRHNSYYYSLEQRVHSTSTDNHLRHPSPPPPPPIDDNMAPFDDSTLANNNNNINRSNNNLPAINTNVNITQEDESGMKRTNNDFQRPPFYDSDNNYDFISSTATTPQQSNQASSSEKSKAATGEGKDCRAKGQKNKAIATPDRQLPLVNSYREEYYDNIEYYHPHGHGHGHGHGYYPYNYEYSHHAPYSYPPATTSSSKINSKNDNNGNSDYRNDDRSTWTQQDQQLAHSHSSVYYKSGWYPQYPPQQDQDQQQAYSPENYRHYMSPSPPPPPPPYSDYYYECHLPYSDGTSRDISSPFPRGGTVSPYYSQYGHSYHPSATGDYSNSWEQHHHHHKDNEKEQTKTTKATASSPETPMARPSEKKKKKTIPKVTPLSNICGRRLSPSTKVAINLPSSKIIVTPPTSGESKSASAFTASTPFITLRNMDIVCGRGAPTNYHIGNEMFRELVTNYHTSYFCAKRSEKPQIAMKVLDVLQSRNARFVRRQKGGRFPTSTTSEKTKKGEDGKGSLSSSQPSKSSYWVEVPHKLAYEKVCQALRDGAPQVQHQILSSTRTIQQSLLREQSKSQKAIQQQRRGHQQQHQQHHSSNNTQECHLRGTGIKNGPTADQGKENGLQK